MRQRNRAVAEREASRLARPEPRPVGKLGHASRKKSAVTSTPSGYNYAAKREETKQEVEEWCGPFSVARQMIAKREEARRKREKEQDDENKEHHPLDEAMDLLEMEKKRKAQPSLQWKASGIPDAASSRNQYAKRQRRVEKEAKYTVPSLFSLCVEFLVDNFEYVEALGDVDSTIRRNICEALVTKQKMNGAAFDVIAEKGVEALELVDCAEVTQDQLAGSLTELLPAGLRFLALQHSGRCFGPKAVKAITSASSCRLFAIAIGGAYLLKDEDMASLISTTALTLSSIDVTACPLLGEHFCKALSENYSSIGNGTLLELFLENLALTKDNLVSLAKSSDALRNLKSLKLCQIESVDDEVVEALLDAVVGGNLEAIDLSHNHNLTDETLSCIRRCNKNGALRSLQLCELKNLTEAGLEAFFTHTIPGLPSPPMLKKLVLNNCSHEAVTDTVMELAAKCSAMNREAVTESLSTMGGLVHVGIHGSSCTDRTMESLAATSARTLKELNASFCPLISDKGLGYLVSKALQLSTIHIWGCAQVTDEFLDGHSRVGDSSFEVIGAWMKQNRVFSVQ
jgi:hypothetical protein